MKRVMSGFKRGNGGVAWLFRTRTPGDTPGWVSGGHGIEGTGATAGDGEKFMPGTTIRVLEADRTYRCN